VTVSEEKKPSGGGLGLDLRPYEYAFLALFAAGMYYNDVRGAVIWPYLLYTAGLLAALPVLILRCPDEWRQLPNRGLFFLLLIPWVAMFVFFGNPTFGYKDTPSLFYWMYDIYTSPLNDEQHGLLIPFVVLVLYWWKRKELLARPAGLWLPAAALVTLGIVIHLVGFLIQQQRISVIGFLVGLYGLTGLVWGKHWLKTSFFPFFLLLFCMPVGELAVSLTLPLRILVAQIVTGIAHLGLAPDVYREGTQLLNSEHTFGYEVAPACSGIRSIVALLALTTIYGFVCFKTPWRRTVMVLSAIPLALLGNVARLTFTITVAELFGQEGGKAVEHYTGFVTFAVAIISALFLGNWLEKGEPRPPVEPAPTPAPVNPVA